MLIQKRDDDVVGGQKKKKKKKKREREGWDGIVVAKATDCVDYKTNTNLIGVVGYKLRIPE